MKIIPHIIIFISICCNLYSSISLAQVPVLKGTSTKPFKILGQLKQSECMRNSTDTQQNLEQKVINYFSRLAESKTGLRNANAVINFSCEHRKSKLFSYDEELQKVIQCNEGVFCTGDVIRWQ